MRTCKNSIFTLISLIILFQSFCFCSFRGLIQDDEVFDEGAVGIEAEDAAEHPVYREHKKIDQSSQIPILPSEVCDLVVYGRTSKLPIDHPLYSLRIQDKWIFLEKLGSGHYGEVYLGLDIVSGEKVAIKVEINCDSRSFVTELQVYQIINRIGKKQINGQLFTFTFIVDGFPTLRHCELLNINYSELRTILIMDLLGPSLYKLFVRCFRKFSLKTVLLLADQMIDRIQTLHENHFIHRDIKPENFVVGLGDSCNKVYLLDFGLAKQFSSRRNPSQHIIEKNCVPFAGTYSYASLNSHQGIEQSRRDDLESLGYVLVMFLVGSLPWQKFNMEKIPCSVIHEVKSKISVTSLCYGLPSEFVDYFEYVRNLGFNQTPDYGYLKRLFVQAYNRHNFEMSSVFDWMENDDTKQSI